MSSGLAGQTRLDGVAVPDWVREVAGDGPVRPVWRNEDGGLTFRFGDGVRFVKAQRPGLDWQPDAERVRLDWVGGFVPAPRVLRHGVHGELHWVLTTGLPGRSAVDPAWLAPALMSLGWNYGPGWEPTFLAAYGVPDDPAKRVYYSALWDGVGDNLGRTGAVWTG